MKIFNRFTYALMALSLLAVSCQEKENFKPGEEEDANCYGVFFPTQDASGFHETDPADEPVCTVKVSRTNTNDAITVPLTVTADTTGIFIVPESISFEAGQADTSIVIDYTASEVGATHSVSIAINDSQYASKYSSNAAYFDFSVQKVKWNDVEGGDGSSMCDFTEDCLTGIFGTSPYTVKVKVQERDDMPGYYRIDGDIWGSLNPDNAPGDWDATTSSWFYVDATDPTHVDIPYQRLGTVDWGYGPFMFSTVYQFAITIYGYTAEQAASKGLYDQLGTMSNGVITFPAKSCAIVMPDYDDPANGYWYGNKNGKLKVILPGGVEVDYSFAMSSNEVDAEGVVAVDVKAGADIDSVKYAVYTGTLTNAQYGDAASAIEKGVCDGAVKCEDGAAVINVTADTTSILTLVAVAFDTTGVAQAQDRVEFGYVKKGDKVPVVFNISAKSVNGYTEDNELAYTVFGKDLTDIKVIAVAYDEVFSSQAAYDAAWAELMDSESLDADNIALANTTGYTGVLGDLLPGTNYVVFAYAFNGYKSDRYGVTATTSGEPKKIYSSWDEVDTLLTTSDSSMVTKYYGTWNYYAKRNGYISSTEKVTDGLRQYIGKVTIEDAPGVPTEPSTEYPGIYDDYVQVIGLMGPFAEFQGVPDTLIFDVYAGYIYNTNNWVYNDGTNAVRVVGKSDNGYYSSQYGVAGAFVEKGYISFFSNSSEQDFNSFAYLYYQNSTAKGYLCWMKDPLLVDPDFDEDNPAAPTYKHAASPEVNRFRNAMAECPVNCVETPTGRMKSIIDRANASKIKVNTTSRDANGVYVPATTAKGVHTEAVSGVNASERTFSKEIKLDAKVSRK